LEDSVDINYLRRRIRELEEKVGQLQLSRRVLMNLIEKIERERSGFVKRLEEENHKLHQDNCRYARRLFRKNLQIVELESKLKNIDPDRIITNMNLSKYK